MAGRYQLLEQAARRAEDVIDPNAPLLPPPRAGRTTVKNSQRKIYPGIYNDPRDIVGEATRRTAPRNRLLYDIFGTTREDLDSLAYERDRLGGSMETWANTRPVAAAEKVMTGANTRRMQNILYEADRRPELAGSYGWYSLDPLEDMFVQELGPELGTQSFKRFNQLGSALSPGTAVPKEIQRSSIAYNWDRQGRLGDFLDPRNLPEGAGHAYHRTAHSGAIQQLMNTGEFWKPKLADRSPKTPPYYYARMGQQTQTPVGDAHWSRGVGLADTRTSADPTGSVSRTELGALEPWFRDEVAGPLGMSPVGAQALQWNALGPMTDLESPVSAPFLELLTEEAARKTAAAGLRVNPRNIEDMIRRFIRGETDLYAGPR